MNLKGREMESLRNLPYVGSLAQAHYSHGCPGKRQETNTAPPCLMLMAGTQAEFSPAASQGAQQQEAGLEPADIEPRYSNMECRQLKQQLSQYTTMLTL